MPRISFPFRLSCAYGEMYTSENSSPQSIPAGSGWTKLTSWTDDGSSSDMIASAFTGQIEVLKDGLSIITATLSISSGTNNVVFDFCVHANGSPINNLFVRRKVSVAGDVGALSITGIAELSASSVVDLRVRHDHSSAVDLTVEYGNLNLVCLEK